MWLGWSGMSRLIAKVMERKRVLGLNVRDRKRGDFDIRYKAGGGEGGKVRRGRKKRRQERRERKKGLDELVLSAVLPTLIYNNATSVPSTASQSDRHYLLSRKKRKRGLPPPPPASTRRQLPSSLPLRLSVPEPRTGRSERTVRRTRAAIERYTTAGGVL